jgi:uncharacterized membrane protein
MSKPAGERGNRPADRDREPNLETETTMRIIGIVLIILGTLALAYQGFTYVTREKVVDVGPVQVTADREKTVWIPPVVGGVAVAAGAAMLIMGGRKTGNV